jgi:PKD domain/Papain family cysteine protease
VPAGSISTTPSYPITSIQWHLIPTRGTGITQDQAINNIKTVLNQNKAVTLGFYLPDFNPFFTFWSSSSGVWNPDLYCGLANGAYPGGHEVTIVGYNDASPSDHYWIVLNSWGNDNAHPEGTFKMDMHMNYACSNSGYYSYDFGYFDVAFSSVNRPPNTPIAPFGPDNGSIEIPYTYVTSANDSDGDQVKYAFDWGDGTPESQTNLVNSGSNASASHIWNTTGTYQVRVRATDNKSASSEWSDATNVTIEAPLDTPPEAPLVPTGPDLGFIGIAYTFVTSATDADGDQVKYTFDWGDGTAESQTNLVNSGSNVSASHTWNTVGTYQIEALATDRKGVSSVWSNATTIAISVKPNTPPYKPVAPTGTITGTIRTSYAYVTSATDPDGDRVKYTFDWGDGTTQSQTGFVNSGLRSGASHSWSTAGTYQVKAMANDSKGATSGWSNETTVVINDPPNFPPNTPSKPYGSASGKAGTSYSYTTYAADPNRDMVLYTFDWGDGTTDETGYVASGTQAAGAHIWENGGTYLVKALANDSKGANSGWSAAKTVIIVGNSPPRTPAKPTGPALGKTGTSYSYATYAADPDRDRVLYTFDRGDGTTTATGYVASGTRATESHTWSSGGTYLVKAMATDSKGANSGWSSPITIVINTPPNSPNVPSGPSSGIHGTYYTYTASANDPEGDKVKCTFDWGDGTISTTGLVNSGASVSASHKWIRATTYQVKAKATDSQGASSGWSGSLSVKIT